MRPNGTVAPGFEPVRDAFAEIDPTAGGGAAFTVLRDGQPLVDLWGGEAAPGRPWQHDTLTVLFSGTKGVTATVVAGTEGIDPQARVAEYWPEFAAAGKQDARVHEILAHTVGLPYVDAEPAMPLADNAANAKVLAAQAPMWTPGERVAYHAMTYGYLLTELVSRAAGTSISDAIARLHATHGIEVYLGTPERVDDRVATMVRDPDYRISTYLRDDPERRAIVERMYGTLLGSVEVVNDPAYRRARLAAGSGVGSAPALARLYDLLVHGAILPRAALDRATRTWSSGTDVINDRPLHFGLGYELADPIGTYGPATVAFGHSGAGGGRHGAWPEAGVGFSFTTNEMRAEDTDDRAARLLEALYSLL